MDELASAGTLDVRCVMIFMLEKKNTRWVVLGNGDVPLDEVAFFTTGLTIYISIAFLEKCGTFFGILRVGKLN